mgnify:FL=1
MLFGLRNAPDTFQQLIDRFRAGLPEVSLVAYLDDLIVLSESDEQHIQDLGKIFERMKLFRLRMNRKKCPFGRSEVQYLGHIVSVRGLEPDVRKVEAIQKIPPPRNVKEVFLQTCS